MRSENTEYSEHEINLLDYLITLLKWKKLISGITLAALFLAAMAALVLPKTYRAESRILPPQQGNSGMAAQLLSQAGLTGLGGMLGGNGLTDLYLGMLQSRTVLDKIITRFELKALYDVRTMDDARKRLRKKINMQSDPKSNVIVITVDDRDARKAAAMANAFVEELRGMTKDLAVTEAAQRRLFFEGQLKETKESLIKAEEAVRGFQERTGTLQVDEQVKAVIKNIAQLRAEIAAKEVEIRVAKTFSKPSNPDLQRSEANLSGMKVELAKLQTRSGNGNDPMMPTGRMPSVGAEYLRKMRDLKVNESLYELLLKQYEAARLDEARDAAIIQVIDRAVPPEKSVKPKMFSLLLMAGFLSFAGSIMLAFFLEQKESACRQPENRERIAQLKRYAAFGYKRG